MRQVILASGSAIRAQLLRAAGVEFMVESARVDEEATRHALIQSDRPARFMAADLADLKACRVSGKYPEALVIGADQLLVFCGEIIGKSSDLPRAKALLRRLSGQTHELVSAAVLAMNGSPVWRNVTAVDMHMRNLSEEFLDAYLERNGPGILSSVGGYQFEAEGAQLFTGYSGDYFSILGLPLLPLLAQLREFGVLQT